MVVDINKSMYFLGIYGFFWPRKKDDVRCSKAIDSLENEYVGMYNVSKMESSHCIPICFLSTWIIDMEISRTLFKST